MDTENTDDCHPVRLWRTASELFSQKINTNTVGLFRFVLLVLIFWENNSEAAKGRMAIWEL